MWIFLALVAVPIIEIALFIELGGWVGLWPTLALVVGTAILGGILLRMQGFAAMQRMQEALEAGRDPTGPIAHGAMILVAGLLMLTPGFFTDAVGFALLIPPVRSAIIAWAGPRLASRIVVNDRAAGRRPAHDGPIEADYVDVTDGPKRPGGSGWTRGPE